MKLLKLLGILAILMVAQTVLREVQRHEIYASVLRINKDLADRPPNPNDLLRRKSKLLRDLDHHDEALSTYEEITAPTAADRLVIAELRTKREAQQRDLQALARVPRHVAALIGVSMQSNLRLPPVQTAQNEVNVMRQVLTAGPAVPLSIRFDISGSDGKSTRQSNIRNALERVISDHSPSDTAYLYISAHGLSEVNGERRAFVMGSDSDPSDKRAAGYAFADFHRLLQNENRGPSKVLVFADVCRLGVFDSRPNLVNVKLRELFTGSKRVQLVLAGCRSGPARGQPQSVEPFTAYLARGLNGEADRNPRNDIVTSREIFTYLRTELGRVTGQREIPERIGAEFDIPLTKVASAAEALPNGESPQRALTNTVPRLFGSISRPSAMFAFAQDATSIAAPTLAQQLFTTNDAAFTSAVEVEDLGQQVILNYLEGPSVPQGKEDFDAAAGFFRLANELNPSPYLVAREAFCSGRSLIFEKAYDRAIQLLKQTIKSEPDAAYAYNAIGIAYLQQALFRDAREAFDEAIRLAPTWPYPALNLALTYSEQGQYREAERAYLAGIRAARPVPYLFYNLGVLYHRLNRKADARRMYQRAAQMDPKAADPHIGIGSIWASGRSNEKNFREAEKAYRHALMLDGNSAPGRHSLALLYLARKEDRYRGEAIRLLDQVIADHPDFLPSKLELAKTLTEAQPGRAALIYCDVLDRHPNLVLARVEYAKALQAAGDAASAERELRRALAAAPANWRIHKALGDLLRPRYPLQAAKAYADARSHAPEGRDRRILDRKQREADQLSRK